MRARKMIQELRSLGYRVEHTLYCPASRSIEITCSDVRRDRLASRSRLSLPIARLRSAFTPKLVPQGANHNNSSFRAHLPGMFSQILHNDVSKLVTGHIF